MDVENYTNIDDMLMGGKTATQPATPESQSMGPAEIGEDMPDDVYGLNEEPETPEPEDDHMSDPEPEPEQEEKPEEDHTPEYDEYGNEKENLSKSMQKRLERQAESLKRKHDAELAELRQQLAQAGASKEVQQAAKDFEFDPNDEGSWEEQFASMVRQTIAKDEQERIQRAQQEEVQRDMQEFRGRMQDGMNRFDDFIEVVGGQPMDNEMTLALRSIQDPAAFIYAASKRMPEELDRIARLKNPHDRYAEVIRLEQKMRQNKPTTKAPRPLGKAKEDAQVPVPKSKKEESIEDLIAKSDAKRLANARGRQNYRPR